MPGLILETAAAVGDKVVNCSSVSKDVELPGPGQKSTGDFYFVRNTTLWVAELSTKAVYLHCREQHLLGFQIKHLKINCTKCQEYIQKT